MKVPYIIEETNLSNAWFQTVEHIIKNPGIEITPLVLTLTKFQESSICRKALDLSLLSHGLGSIDTVSETIFPDSLYQFCKQDSTMLYEIYITQNLPRIKKIDKLNRKGTYFERLISFGERTKVNQLAIIIASLKDDSKIKRRSKLQASIFDPLKDHTNGPFQGFPCLQHVTFYKSETGGLIINSFYAVQYLYQRAYGNWLGLINLGKFVANESGLELERLNCFIGVEKLDHLTKKNAEKLLNKINS